MGRRVRYKSCNHMVDTFVLYCRSTLFITHKTLFCVKHFEIVPLLLTCADAIIISLEKCCDL